MKITPEDLDLSPRDLDAIWRDLAAYSEASLDDFRFSAETSSDGGIVVQASRSALIRMALELVALAHNGIEGSHLHIDAAGWADPDSATIIVGLA